MARNTHVSGHVDRISGLVRTIAALSKEVALLRRIVTRDALLAPGYRLEVRPEADPPGLYIVNTRSGTDGEEEARFLCP
jgi:hypothetical protein